MQILKIGTPKIVIGTVLKVKQLLFFNAVMCLKEAAGTANSVDPDQTAPKGAV